LSSAENLQTTIKENLTTRPRFIAQGQGWVLKVKAKAKDKNFGLKAKAKA